MKLDITLEVVSVESDSEGMIIIYAKNNQKPLKIPRKVDIFGGDPMEGISSMIQPLMLQMQKRMLGASMDPENFRIPVNIDDYKKIGRPTAGDIFSITISFETLEKVE